MTSEINTSLQASMETQQTQISERAPLRVVVLISGSGSNLQALIDAIESNSLPGVEIALVVSNKAGALGMQRALKHKIAALYLPWRTREEWEAKLSDLLRLFQADMIVLAGFMRILSSKFIERYPQGIINLHPALIPDDGAGETYTTSDGNIIPVFRGMHAPRQALEAGVAITGSTVHYVVPEVDAGPPICRREVIIEDGDTEDSLQERIKLVEHHLIVEAIRLLQQRTS
ncbi:phosphoribosylglycinamide formyltransferase [Ktedonospora formicarum]|uniref:Phosphoribosylglycinamide formyltransferase n=1 Tax=Ktedonospora formicarum TaxID=2778364 RepID=A0A8J3I0F6_9CHLR|nr:phosphoribosylglycinamide formyltransferase [Ktedonospora formicarum]GHO44393.1 phosphoribosylglycinamide formyltransferase [Ktedonospora formicarum]